MLRPESQMGQMLRHDLRFGILNWIGIIDQLSTTQANRLLSNTALPFTQFITLNHFSHRPTEGKTVSGIARAMQLPQPGVSKTVQKLLDKGFLAGQIDPADTRSRLLLLTEAGSDANAQAIAWLTPALRRTFNEWSDADMMTLFGLLDRLKKFLDADRLDG